MRGRDTGQDVLAFVIVSGLLLGLFVSIVWTLAGRFRRYRLGLVEAEPKCARCGYIVHPGSGPICPECGGERLKVGVFTPATAPPIFPWPLSVGVYILLAIAAFWVGPLIARLTPWEWDFRAWRTIETSDSLLTSGLVEGVLFWIAASLVAGRFIDRWHWRRRQRALERKAQLFRDLGLAPPGTAERDTGVPPVQTV
jgi:hypothetical protein